MTAPDVYDMVGQIGLDGTELSGPDGTVQDSADVHSTNESSTGSTDLSDLDAIDPPILAGRQHTLSQVKMAAYNGEFPDEHATMPDRIFWWAMRDMYQRFRAGQISKAQGEEEQAKAMQQYRQDMTQYNEMVGVVHRIATFWKQIEAAASEYAKCPNRTAEADKFYNAVYGALPKGK